MERERWKLEDERHRKQEEEKKKKAEDERRKKLEDERKKQAEEDINKREDPERRGRALAECLEACKGLKGNERARCNQKCK